MSSEVDITLVRATPGEPKEPHTIIDLDVASYNIQTRLCNPKSSPAFFSGDQDLGIAGRRDVEQKGIEELARYCLTRLAEHRLDPGLADQLSPNELSSRIRGLAL